MQNRHSDFSITEQEAKDIYMNELPGQAHRNTSNNFKVTFLSLLQMSYMNVGNKFFCILPL